MPTVFGPAFAAGSLAIRLATFYLSVHRRARVVSLSSAAMLGTASARTAGVHARAPLRADAVVSVIVPVRNESADLRRLVDALRVQTLPRERFEVVVGDDGSTADAVRAVATADGWVQVTSGPPLNSYAARNRAVQSSRGEILAFCDADCLPEPDWLERGLAALEDADVVAGLVRFVVPQRRTIWTLLDMDTFLDQERAVRARSAVTANLFARREIYDRVGGFDDAFPNQGDHDFVSRCAHGGARLVFARDAVVDHPTRDSGRSFLRKVWVVNRMYAARETRAGRLPGRLRPRTWAPLVPTLRTRRHFGRSRGLDRRRLAEHGVRATALEQARAIGAIYVLLPYLSGLAQVRGWWSERRS